MSNNKEKLLRLKKGFSGADFLGYVIQNVILCFASG